MLLTLFAFQIVLTSKRMHHIEFTTLALSLQKFPRTVMISPHQAEKREVGVDFINPFPGFWRISFPPPDWTMRSPEAKRDGEHRLTKPASKTKK